MLRSFGPIVVGVLAASSLLAQETRGNLVGRVSDSSGAFMPRATIQATHQGTGTVRKTTSNEEGLYQFPYLLPGIYTVQAQASGFKTLVREGIEVRINDRIELNLSMEVGGVGERIEVVGETPLLQTATASMGQVVPHRLIADLPLLHGNPMAVLALTPGMAQSRTTDLGLWGGRVFDNAWTTSFASDGVGQNSHEITLDGVANTTSLGGTSSRNHQTVAYTPPADMVDEFKVQTASFDASVGYTSGTVINMSVKAGTRDLHGTAYYFKIAPELVANQWFGNRASRPKTDFTYNRWGGSITGPVDLPKVYNGRDRTFFSYGYEGHHDRVPYGSTYTVPTAEQRKGDFSGLLKLGSQYQIYDPMSARLLANGRIERDPIAGNVLPPSRISPMTQPLTQYWGQPRVAGTADGGSNFPDPTQPDPNRYYSHAARLDHSVSNNNRLYGRVAVSKHLELDYGDPFLNAASGKSLYRYNRGAVLDDVHTFSPRLVLDLRYGYTRFRQGHIPQGLGFDPASVGFDKVLMSQIDPQAYVFPYFNVSDYTTLGGVNPDDNATDIHDWTASVNFMRGSHNLKFGGDYRVYLKTGFWPGQAVPALAFGTNFTRGPYDNSPAAPRGQGLASFLLGIPTGGYLDRNANYAERSKGFALYLQDDWKLSRRLSVTLGLRYEFEGPLAERFNRSVSQYDFTTHSPIEAQAKAKYATSPLPELPADRFNVIGGLLFAGVGGSSSGLYDAPAHSFMPRFGLAYSMTPTTVIRAGYGIFYGYLGVRRSDANQIGFSQRTEVIPTLDNGLTFRFKSLSNPFVDGLLNPTGASLGLQTYLGRAIGFFDPHPLAPYMQRWTLSIQRVLPSQILFEAAYVGNRGTHIEVGRDYDALPNQWLSKSPVRDQATINSLTTPFPNPFYPLLPGTNLAGTTVARTQLLLAYPQFTSLAGTSYQGFSWYHALQLKAERRFAQGFTFQSAYTWSKFMEATGYLNAGDLYPERAISSQDYPHCFSLSAIYELPLGRGKPLLGSASGVGGKVIGGWQVQGLYTGQSGPALGFGNAIFTGNLHDIPLPTGQRSVDRWFNTNAGFDRNSATQLSYNLRTFSSRFSGVRGDGINQLNLSVIKNTRISESKSVQFRAEAMNALNHVMFVNPNTSPTSTGFGTITNEKSSARAIQLALKFLF